MLIILYIETINIRLLHFWYLLGTIVSLVTKGNENRTNRARMIMGLSIEFLPGYK